MKFSRNETCMLKGIAIILMLYHHLFTFPDRIATGIEYVAVFPEMWQKGSAYHFAWIGKLCVGIFAFLAGYGTYISCVKKNEKKEKEKVIFYKVKGLYKIFWSVFLIFIPLSMLLGVPRVKKDIVSFVLNFAAVNTTYNGEWWFITSWLILMGIYAVFHSVIEKKRGIISEIFIIVSINIVIRFVVSGIVGLPCLKGLASSWQWIKFYAAISLLPLFLIGCVFAKYDLYSKLKEYAFNKKISSKIGACITLMLVICFRSKVSIEYDYVLVPLFCGSIIILLQGKLWTWLRWLLEKIGEEGTYIWLIHTFYCYTLCQKLVYYPRFSILIVIWLLIMSYITAKVIRLVVKLIEKVFYKIDSIKIKNEDAS